MSEEEKSFLKNEGALGKIEVSKDVIALISGLSTMEVEGVESITYQIKSGTYSPVPKDSFQKGIETKISENGVDISINLMTNYEKGIYSVAKEVQKNVKEVVEKMTGKPVSRIDINITGIKMPNKGEKDGN